MRLPRWLHHLYANVASYFWIPCPRCGRHFGGHEEPQGYVRSPFSNQLTCPRCPTETKLRLYLVNQEMP